MLNNFLSLSLSLSLSQACVQCLSALYTTQFKHVFALYRVQDKKTLDASQIYFYLFQFCPVPFWIVSSAKRYWTQAVYFIYLFQFCIYSQFMCRSINCVYFLVVLGLCLFFMLYQFVVVWDLLSAYHRWEKKEKKKEKERKN